MEQSLLIQICGLQRFTDREGVVVQLTAASQVENDQPVDRVRKQTE
jgi:hypothetical protein